MTSVTELYFQLVRCGDLNNIEKKLFLKIKKLKDNKIRDVNEFLTLYRLVGQTRDIICGKGERDLSFLQIYVWYQFYPELAFSAFYQFIYPHSLTEKSYGSWKDIKTFCHFIKNKTKNEEHPLILFAINIMNYQLFIDYQSLSAKNPRVSLAGKWAPRQRSKMHWLFKKMAYQYYSYFFFKTKKFTKAKNAAKMYFRKILSTLNSFLNTPQVLMSRQNWSKINFEKISSKTLFNYRKSFLNETKSKDRKICSQNFKTFINKKKFISNKRCEIYEFVRAAFFATNNDEIEFINKQWKGLSSVDLGYGIPIIDVGISSMKDNNIPLYNAIGLGIKISENTRKPFKNRLMIYGGFPQWISFPTSITFVEKVNIIKEQIILSSANIFFPIYLILNSFVKNNLPFNDVSKMGFYILSGNNNSGRQNDIYTDIQQMFFDAGILSIGTPYYLPHFVFWNLYSTNFLPANIRENNVTLVSGYTNNVFKIIKHKACKRCIPCDMVIEEETPKSKVNKILLNKRYDILANIALKYISKII
jgi:hypothetical protein